MHAYRDNYILTVALTSGNFAGFNTIQQLITDLSLADFKSQPVVVIVFVCCLVSEIIYLRSILIYIQNLLHGNDEISFSEE